MLRTGITRARTATAVAAAALLLVAGCDDGGDQAAAPESPAEQGTEAAGEESNGGGEDNAAEESTDGEDSTAGEDGSGEGADETEQDSGSGEEADDTSAGPIDGDPCADLTAADVGSVLGNDVGDREDEANQGLPEGTATEGLVVCQYQADDVQTPSASLFWMLPTIDYPDEMPEEVREEQEESRVSQMIAGGEEIEVEGASAATVEVTTEMGVTQVTVKAAVGDTVLHSSLVTEAGGLDESDIPTAVELAELAISKA